MSKFKKIKFLIFLFLFLIGLSFFFLDNIRIIARTYIPGNVKILIKEKFFGKQYLEEIAQYRMSNYNQKILPESQFEYINTKEIKLNKFDNQKRFYIENYKDDFIALSAQSDILLVKGNDLTNQISISSNLANNKLLDIRDFKIIDNKIIVAARKFKNETDECSNILILLSEINEPINNFEFKKIYESEKCAISNRSIKIEKSEINNNILIATSANYAHGKAIDEDRLAQSDSSIFGKILSLNLENRKIKILAKGIRFPKSITNFNGKILFTDGYNYNGDEINIFEEGANYGWPIASLGEDDNAIEVLDKKISYKYEKNHSKLNFKEPIISFLPSILINSLINIPDDFSVYWKNDFLLSGGTNLYRIRFDSNFKKVIFYERIVSNSYIGDMIYLSKNKVFVFSSSGKILVLKKKG